MPWRDEKAGDAGLENQGTRQGSDAQRIYDDGKHKGEREKERLKHIKQGGDGRLAFSEDHFAFCGGWSTAKLSGRETG